MGMKPPYTSRQGQFLGFIHHYTTLHERPPAEAEMARFFQVTVPNENSVQPMPDAILRRTVNLSSSRACSSLVNELRRDTRVQVSTVRT